MNTFRHGPSLVSLHFLSFYLPFFPKIKHCYFTSLQGLQDVENHCAHLTNMELKTGRRIPQLCFPMYYSLYNWIGEHETSKLKKIYFLRKKKRTKTTTKKHERNEITQKRLPLVTTTYRPKNNTRSKANLLTESIFAFFWHF